MINFESLKIKTSLLFFYTFSLLFSLFITTGAIESLFYINLPYISIIEPFSNSSFLLSKIRSQDKNLISQNTNLKIGINTIKIEGSYDVIRVLDSFMPNNELFVRSGFAQYLHINKKVYLNCIYTLGSDRFLVNIENIKPGTKMTFDRNFKKEDYTLVQNTIITWNDYSKFEFDKNFIYIFVENKIDNSLRLLQFS